MDIYNSYTYLIGWKTLQTYYYGIRYAKNCKTEELFNTYFTSSKYVKEFLQKHGTPDIIEIRKKFNDVQKAQLWESKVLRRINAKDRKDFLNKTDNKSISSEKAMQGATKKRSKSFREKLSSYRKGKKHSEETRKKMSEAAKSRKIHGMSGKKHTEKTRKKLSEIGKTKIGNKNNCYGKKHSEETKLKISLSKRTKRINN